MRQPRTLKQLLTRYRIAVWQAEHPEARPDFTGGPPQYDRRLARMNAQGAREYRAAAVQMLAGANKRQLARWLASKDAYLRAFVIENVRAVT